MDDIVCELKFYNCTSSVQTIVVYNDYIVV